jgi:hypothetical protein
MERKIIGFTGTQKGMTEAQKAALGNALGWPGTLHHGDDDGADKQADVVARRHGFFIEVHPPIEAKRRAFCGRPNSNDVIWKPKEYLDRNRDIVDCCDFLIATPKGRTEERRSGTWATIRYAKNRGVAVLIIYPDGEEKWIYEEEKYV